MKYEDFLRIAEYGNKNWKGSFTKSEVEQNARDYYDEFLVSQDEGKPTSVMQSLCELLIADIDGGSEESHDFLMDILSNSDWWIDVFECEHCGKKEIVFFTMKEIENLMKHSNREMLITEAIPEKPAWVREVYVSGLVKCEECWKKYFNGEFL